MRIAIPLPESPRLVSREGNRAVFEVAALYPGYGVTLGNALRRVLLSSLPGAAVTEVMFRGVPHEFTTIPGVQETVLDVTLNIKQLRFKMFSDEPQVLTLSKKGDGVLTSDDIKAPAQVNIVSKGLHLATLTDKKAEVEMDLTVERGVGYVPADARKKEKMQIGSIALDAIFTPVRNANFTVESMRVGDRTDYNLLRFMIETDGTMAPEEAFAQASSILVKQFSTLIPEDFRGEEDGGVSSGLLKEPLATLGLSSRTISALEAGGIRTVAGLTRKKASDIGEIEGIGGKAREEIVEALQKHGLALK